MECILLIEQYITSYAISTNYTINRTIHTACTINSIYDVMYCSINSIWCNYNITCKIQTWYLLRNDAISNPIVGIFPRTEECARIVGLATPIIMIFIEYGTKLISDNIL